jgi:hypothetical protein
VCKLRIAIGMVAPFAGLAIALQAIAQCRQQFADFLPTDAMPDVLERLG